MAEPTIANNEGKSATAHLAQGHHFDSSSRARNSVQRFECQSLCTEIVEDPLVATTYFQRFECRSTPTREYQQRQPSLKHRAAGPLDERRPRNDRTITHDGENGKILLT
jgi:hypothetical protein